MLFRDRREAGRTLAEQVISLPESQGSLVLALPRGGVPVGFEIATSLRSEFDVFVVRKLGLPGEEELALGAVASGGVRVLNRELIQHLKVPDTVIETITAREMELLEARERFYRENRPQISTRDRTVILVDDGLATGASMLAAVRALRTQSTKKIIVAVPVAARSTYEELRTEVDHLICAATPHPFGSVGRWYEHFGQVADQEVRMLLDKAADYSATCSAIR